MNTNRANPARAAFLARRPPRVGLVLALLLAGSYATAAEPPAKGRKVDFNRDVRPILSNACFQCHGPDAGNRKGLTVPLRLDTAEGARADLGGYAAITPGDPDESEALRRITSDDATEQMPPHKAGKAKLTEAEVATLTEWIRQGAEYAPHWAYVRPTRPAPPDVREPNRIRNPIDRFILARLDAEGLKPAPEADRYALIRRVTLDLTGLPPTLEEVDAFRNDTQPGAYERLVDGLLDRPAYGEHWARLWLDLARYADSAGYADDPARTIWAFRDYVIRSLNANKPFDRFTVEQIAGDLLPNPTEDQLVATAFHRNTLTNNEGGTNDEEFRNVAIVDRVNTTMAVWMGTTIACAQCHDHKYDPLSQQDFFRLFAILNNTEDADRRDESPFLPLFSDEQRRRESALKAEAGTLEATLRTPTPALLSAQAEWERSLAVEPDWRSPEIASATAASGAPLAIRPDGSIAAEPGRATDTYRINLPLANGPLSALRIETLPDEKLPGGGPGLAGNGNFVISRVTAAITPPDGARAKGRFVRVELPGKDKILSLAEVQVLDGADNAATGGKASQSSTEFGGDAARAVDGNTDGLYEKVKSTTHTAVSQDPWWEVDLGAERPVDRVVVWNRTDNGLHTRLNNFRVSLLDATRQPVWTKTVVEPPNPSATLDISGVRPVLFAVALADYAQPNFEPAAVLDGKDPARGWAIDGQTGRPHALTLVPAAPVEVPPGSTLSVTIEQQSTHTNHTLGRFRVGVTGDDRAAAFARIPADIRAILKAGDRDDARRAELTRYYLAEVAPELQPARDRLAVVKRELADLKPMTTVPIQRELPADRRRTTHIQLRGNYLAHGDEVSPGVPAALHPLPEGAPADRLGLARWLVSPDNPLTARVIANRYWEALFGIGLVATSEEFGAQGDQPSHPELLDWLAVEFMESGWDLKHLVRLLVTSAAYRQDSRVTPEQLAHDPDNRLLARGPRFRLPAEAIRDQALAVAGLLSPKLYGPPVKPPQPNQGLSAAFGGGIDWETSKGDDRYRRGLYTTWRRSNPYPSMATFDAPNREVCTLHRTSTNTPLQALVTLNDPVFVEAAQGLARRMVAASPDLADRARLGFRLCVARPPGDAELDRLVHLYEQARADLADDPEAAKKLANDPIGPAPDGADVVDLAAWTVVGNVLLNLDETLMKR